MFWNHFPTFFDKKYPNVSKKFLFFFKGINRGKYFQHSHWRTPGTCVRSILEIPLIKKNPKSIHLFHMLFPSLSLSNKCYFVISYVFCVLLFTDRMVILFSKIWLTSDTVTGDAGEGKHQTSQTGSLTTWSPLSAWWQSGKAESKHYFHNQFTFDPFSFCLYMYWKSMKGMNE